MFYIQNSGFIGNAMIWWKKDRKGYTTDIREAGKYSKEEAQIICQRPEDLAWPCEYIDNLLKAHKLIVDGQYVDMTQSRAWRGKSKAI